MLMIGMRRELKCLYNSRGLRMETEVGDLPFTIPMIKDLLELKKGEKFKIILEKEEKK